MALKKVWVPKLFSCNLNTRDTLATITTPDAFLKEGQRLTSTPKITSKDQFLDQHLWHNSLIKIVNKPVFFKDWCTKGIIMVKHLLGPDNNTFLSLKDFRSKYDFDPPPLSLYGLISAVSLFGLSQTFKMSRTLIMNMSCFQQKFCRFKKQLH